MTIYLTNLNINSDNIDVNQLKCNKNIYSIGYIDLSNVELDITISN